MSLYVRIFLKHYYNFSVTFNVILMSISGTGKVDSVIIFNILGHPKIVTSDFLFSFAVNANEQRIITF